MKKFLLVLVVALCASNVPLVHSVLVYQPIALPDRNDWIKNYHLTFPSGDITLGGVLFNTPVMGFSCWNADIYIGHSADTVTYEIPVNVFGVQEVQTLINTIWGTSGESYAKIEFYGTGSAYYSVDLYAGSDIRDWWNGGWVDTINGTTTTQVWLDSTLNYPRVDKQQFVLPTEFYSQTLQKVVMTDTGAEGFQRLLVSGVSVGVPEPATIGILGFGALSLIRRKK